MKIRYDVFRTVARHMGGHTEKPYDWQCEMLDYQGCTTIDKVRNMGISELLENLSAKPSLNTVIRIWKG